jgi:hypothetical protein
MKIIEVLMSSDKALFEAVDAENDTEIATSDLVNIIKSVNGPWSGPMTSDEFEKYINVLDSKHG